MLCVYDLCVNYDLMLCVYNETNDTFFCFQLVQIKDIDYNKWKEGRPEI